MPDTTLAGCAPLAASTFIATPAVLLTPLPSATRFIFRGRPTAIVAVSGPLGFSLPQTACRVAQAGTRTALWLGPDEWLLLAPEAEGPLLAETLGTALAGLPHALVDVSHRQSGLTLSGPRAAATLNAGCPLDFDAENFPAGMCTRTVLGKAEITLWRLGAEAFRIEAWNSFFSYVWRFVNEAAREFRA